MQVIKSSDIINIIRKTLGLVDARLIDHGERVAYIVYKMMQYSQKYELKEMINTCIISIFHDIGAYKTDEIDNMLIFETKEVWNHSVYGYLFIRNMSPLSKYADAILYHHLDYCKFHLVDCKNKDVAWMINLADRMDVYLSCSNAKKEVQFLEKYRDKKFSNELINLFLRADNEYHIIDNLQNGTYLKDIIKLVEISFTESEIDQYLKMLVYSIDFRSEFTVTHTMTTVSMSVEIAKAMQLSSKEVKKIYYGSLLHDLGKISTPLAILESTGKLNKEEMKIMMAHVTETGNIITGFIDEEVCKIAVRHHEKLDGTGYPLGLTGDQLTISQRIVGVADIISALSGQRSYKKGFDKSKILNILMNLKNNNKLCPDIVDLVINKYDILTENANKNCEQVLETYQQMKIEFIRLYNTLSGLND